MEESKSVVVILVGAPGSGKSTFCDNVMRSSSRSWVRICQDTVGNGKAGTKAQCLASASSALKDGKSVFIDRCNINREQRADFVNLHSSHVDVHAVVLDLPAKLCISRSVKRRGHEGNLQGGKAAAVVNQMLQKKELPKLSEGFSRITFCQNESDVQAAVTTYSELDPLCTLPSGCFGQKNPDSKVQLGIMKFLKKVDAPSSARYDTSVSQDSVANQVTKEKTPSNKLAEQAPASSNNTGKEVEDDQEMGSFCDTNLLDSVPTLAFPSISTADFQFNLEKASDIIVEKVAEYVEKLGNARLVLVDLSNGSKILSLVRSKAAQKNINSSKFFTFVGDITCLYSQGDLRCNVIANAANWRLKPGGGGVNAAIFRAAGPTLEIATKERAESLAPGKAVVVPLPSSSRLFRSEGVTHVIHVLGPNMNPQRPNFLNKDYTNGCIVLREAYSSLFEGFASILRSREKLSKEKGEEPGSKLSTLQDRLERGPVDQILDSNQKVKREGVYASEISKKYKGSQDELGSSITNFRGGNDKADDETKGWGSWAQALYQIAMHPERNKNDVIEVLDDVVVMSDLYPKAQKHLLVLARAEGLDRLADVRKEHLQLLSRMHAVGLKWVEKFLAENESLVFRLGYHSEPSMRQLHLHVISQDFDSKHLKNKKHWNSFNAVFFRDSVDVMEEIREHGKAKIEDEGILSMELRCNRCRSAHPNIPRLKSHVSSCRAPFPATLLQNRRLVFASTKDGRS
ncbi:hypothetical protein RJ639_037007 [Escallonia herrerae]|uniref:Macro domain-containing protein n=1 Tax=Escallonia herrerae TaxID=1293975 RepID=A0AA88WYL9_9ASTE|nr:hypothetical protein RJ639_037007 [Escallonia herrerae]